MAVSDPENRADKPTRRMLNATVRLLLPGSSNKTVPPVLRHKDVYSGVATGMTRPIAQIDSLYRNQYQVDKVRWRPT
jgi:hypothetical protein